MVKETAASTISASFDQCRIADTWVGLKAVAVLKESAR